MVPVPLPFKTGVPGIGGPIITAGGVAFYPERSIIMCVATILLMVMRYSVRVCQRAFSLHLLPI
ncbi:MULTISPECIES: hypothetical protein [Psychrobacter]|uniref:hypothetical protein n=1 Tax=Psychrobacter TaxID=497 RepID=UPI003FD17462